jgi:hypothetical protein
MKRINFEILGMAEITRILDTWHQQWIFTPHSNGLRILLRQAPARRHLKFPDMNLLLTIVNGVHG